MTYEEMLAYCLSKPGAWEDMPWEEDVVVKVAEKIFAFLGGGTSVGVKCGRNRDEADEWLLRYPEDASVMAYIGRSGWNTLRLNGAIPDDELREAIDDSYVTIVSKLPRADVPPPQTEERHAKSANPVAGRVWRTCDLRRCLLAVRTHRLGSARFE